MGGSLGLWVGFSVLTVLEFVEFFVDCLVIGFIKAFRRFSSTKKLSSAEKATLDDMNNAVNPSVLNPGTDRPRKYPDNIMARSTKRIGNKVYRTNPIKSYAMRNKTSKKSPQTGKVTPKCDSRLEWDTETPDPSNAYYRRSRVNTGIGEYGRGIMTPTDVDPRILARETYSK